MEHDAKSEEIQTFLSFKRWCEHQKVDDTPLGDFITFVVNNPDFPDSRNKWVGALRYDDIKAVVLAMKLRYGAMAAADEAWEKYLKAVARLTSDQHWLETIRSRYPRK